jgi:hypothetical protein
MLHFVKFAMLRAGLRRNWPKLGGIDPANFVELDFWPAPSDPSSVRDYA